MKTISKTPTTQSHRVRPSRSAGACRDCDGVLDVRIAENRRALRGAFELIYRSYVAIRYVPPHPGRLIYRSIFGHGASRTIISVGRDDRVVGTVTVVDDSASKLPMEATYAREVRSLRDSGQKVVELTCLAIQSSEQFASSQILFELTRFAVRYACWRQFDHLLFIIHPRHERFYRCRFGATRIGPRRPHEAVGGRPAVACHIDLRDLEHLLLYTDYFAEEIEPAKFMQPPIQPADHRYFCRRMGIGPDAESERPTRSERHAA